MNNHNIVEKIITKTEEYLAIPSVVGFEKPFIDYLEHDFAKIGCRTERFHTLLIATQGAGECVFSAHGDRHGLVSEGNGSFHYAAQFLKQKHHYEEWNTQLPYLKKVATQYQGHTIQAYDPDTGDVLRSGVVQEAHFCEVRQNIIFSVPELQDISAYVPAFYEKRATQCAADEYAGQIDNVISVATAYVLLASGVSARVVITPQEEIGHSWRFLYAYLSQGQLLDRRLIVLDTSPFQHKDVVQQGAVVLRSRDANGCFSAALLAHIKNLCDQSGIPYVVRDELLAAQNTQLEKEGKPLRSLGSTELGHVMTKANPDLNATTLQLPTYNYHENDETTSHLALQNYFRVLSLLAS